MLEMFSALLGNYIAILITVCGVYLTVKTKALQLRKIGKMLHTVFPLGKKSRKTSGMRPFAAMSAALSGTMGTGNIVGVGIAISSGGAGAIFWMLLASFLCMIIKYAETYLAVQYRVLESGTYKGGPMYYMKFGLQKFGALSIVFCIFCILASFLTGNLTQSAAIAECAENTFNVSPLTCGLITALLCSYIIFSPMRRLGNFMSTAIPVLTALFMFFCIGVIIMNRSNFLYAVQEILTSAFDFKSASGGICGFAVSSAMREGFSKGLFTNEAGMGSSPIVHASADDTTPEKQGLYGMAEVFLDTTVMCSITGLAIVISDEHISSNGALMLQNALVSSFSEIGGIFCTVAIFMFAACSIVTWSHYGTEAVSFLCKSKSSVIIYRTFFCVMIVFGAVTDISNLFCISDILNGLMVLPNIITVVLLFNANS